MTDHRNADSTPPDWEAVARHLAGEDSGAERARVEAFLRENPADAELLRALGDASARVPVEPVPGLDVERALRRTKARFDTPVVALPAHQKSRQRPIFAWVGLAAAAAIAVVLFRDGPSPAVVEPAPEVVHRGTPGKVDSVRLADGTMAILAPGAELRVPANFAATDRTVRLTGQGWFRAVHDDARPFTVLAGDAVVRDIGTVFSISLGVNGMVRVAVHEGAVAVRGTSSPTEVELAEGDEVTVSSAVVQSPQRGTVKGGDADWTSGRLHFVDVSMEQFSRTVSEWTGLVVRLEDPGLRVLRVNQDVTLAEARQRLEEAATVLGARVEWKGDTAVVSRVGGR